MAAIGKPLQPTPTGLAKYPGGVRWGVRGETWIGKICRCGPDCPKNCRGECGYQLNAVYRNVSTMVYKIGPKDPPPKR